MGNKLILLMPVALPALFSLPVARVRDRVFRNRLTFLALALTAVSALLAALCGAEEFELWRLGESLPILFRLDGVSRLFLVLISCMWALGGVYSFEYMEHDGHQPRYYLFYLLTLSVLMGLSMSGNLITLYMFYELMTLLSMPLVLHEMSKEAIAAGIKYLLYSIFGASMALLGIFFYYRYGTSLAFTPGGVLTAESMAGHEGLMLWGTFAMLVGFGVKAGMFPLHGWLPTAHPVAPAPASAVLSGVITKAGVLGIIRVLYYLAGPDFLRGSWVQEVFMGLAVATVFMGSMLAYRENLFKKRLAYSTVSQVSYVLTGLATLTPMGLVGGLMHVVAHSVIKDALFMTAGAVIHQTGKTRVDELTGIGKQMPTAIWCFTIASAGLIGIPPTIGFVSKWYLAGGALRLTGSAYAWLAPCVLLVSAILTAGYLLPITIRGFFPGQDFDYSTLEKKEPGSLMLIPLVILAALTVALGALPGGLLRFFQSIADSLL